MNSLWYQIHRITALKESMMDPPKCETGKRNKTQNVLGAGLHMHECEIIGKAIKCEIMERHGKWVQARKSHAYPKKQSY